MRTTLTLDSDVAQKLRAATARKKQPFRAVVNEAIRRGLDEMDKPQCRKPYRMKPRKMGLRPGLSLDNIQELISQVEGEDAR